jgi:hypothetical protein
VSAPENIVTPSAVFVVYGERCRSARKAVSYYRAQTWAHQSARFGALADRTPIARGKTCRWARFAAEEWVARAKEAAESLRAWFAYHWDWRSWLPAVWRRLGACETGYGREPGDWTWDSGSYVSAFGIYRDGYANDAHRIGNLSWDETKRRLGRLPTPREQYEAALSHYREHGGFSGWGCRGA